MSPLVTYLASQGLLGVLLVIVGLAYWAKDKELQEERLARIEDAKAYTDLALKLQEKVIDAVNKLSDVLDQMKALMVPSNRTIGGGR